jgi:menaquinone-dependent protoporphyrinogen oxidase
MTKILLTYASMAGSTAEVAQKMAETLRQQGAEVDVQPMQQVSGFDGVDAVVIGAPMIVGWHREATRFLKTHQPALSQLPVAYFITCVELTPTSEDTVKGVPIDIDPALGDAPDKPDKLNVKQRRTTPAVYLEPILNAAPQVKPVQVGFFAGKIDFSKLGLLPKLFVRFVIRAKEGDRRNWAAIEAWADALGQQLTSTT